MKKVFISLERPVTFYPQLARIFGGIEAALFIQQIGYWSDLGSREDGFIYKTKEDIEIETTLTRRQQDRVKESLIQFKVLEVKLIKANGAPTLHYRLNIDLINKILADNNPISTKGTNGKVQNIQMKKHETCESLTKSTTKTTTEKIDKSIESANTHQDEGIIFSQGLKEAYEEHYSFKPVLIEPELPTPPVAVAPPLPSEIHQKYVYADNAPRSLTTHKKRPNKTVDELINTFKQCFQLPILDGSEKQNRQYAALLMRKFKEKEKCLLIIETASKDPFWSTKITSLQGLYYKAVLIISTQRDKTKSTAFVGMSQQDIENMARMAQGDYSNVNDLAVENNIL